MMDLIHYSNLLGMALNKKTGGLKIKEWPHADIMKRII